MARTNYIHLYPFLLALAWMGAWVVALRLGVSGSSGYWIAAKAVVWILPVWALVRFVEHEGMARFVELRRFGRAASWGAAVAAVWLMSDFLLVAHPAGKHLELPAITGAFVNAAAVAPLVEEVVFRGFMLRRLEMSGSPFWLANVFTTLAFLLMHLVGWHYQGRMGAPAQVARMVAPLCLLSVVLGWLKHRTGSLYAPLTLHVLNNLYNACLTAR